MKFSTARSALIGAVIGVVLIASACSPTSQDATDTTTEAGPGFPVSIDHVYGETAIEAKPERIVTLGWMTQDIVSALGTAPVGVPTAWGGDADGYNPWFRTQVEDTLGAELPTVLADEAEPDYEAILGLNPDLILAPHSGVTDEQYERLTEIAPTVAFAEKPWFSGDWEDLTTVVGTAMGEEEKAQELIELTQATMDDATAAHPELKDTNFLYGQTFPEGQNNMFMYVSDDPRVKFLREFGLVDSPKLGEAVKGAEKDSYYAEVSLEQLDPLGADIFVAWSDTPEQTKYSLAHPTFSRWAPITADDYYIIEDAAMGMATNGPTVLSIPWAIEEGFLDDLSKAAEGGAVVRPAQ